MKRVHLPPCLKTERVVVVDVETTGFKNSDRVIELGLIWIEDEEVIMDLSKLCNPGIVLPDEIVELTGITQEEVEEADDFEVIADFLIDVMQGPSTVVAYNSKFDFRFLRKEVQWCGKELDISDSVIDPLPWVRNEDRGKKCSLSIACKRRGVRVKDAHRALADCYMTVGLMETLRMPPTLMEALEFQHSIGDGYNKCRHRSRR